MHVSKTPGDIARPEAIQRTPTASPATESSDGAASAPRTDAVTISDAGRALASSQAAEGTAPASLDPAQADAIRGKILGGAYDSLAMADQVARSILRSGDL